ncbi:prepilin peptidase [Lelliottia sp.]|uniref:prepilin peptidase n=1 Tax=Lelliottia sp. TaxID=1898429 RepID=UPI003890E454
MFAAFPFLVIYATLTYFLIREDIRFGLLPDKYVCPLLWTGLLFHLINDRAFLTSAVGGAIVGYTGFAFLYWGFYLMYKREGLGYGDVKYLAALGAWHGWYVLPALTLVAALLGATYVVIMVLLKPRMQIYKNPLPFGPFMAAAGLLTGWQSLITLPL